MSRANAYAIPTGMAGNSVILPRAAF